MLNMIISPEGRTGPEFTLRLSRIKGRVAAVGESHKLTLTYVYTYNYMYTCTYTHIFIF